MDDLSEAVTQFGLIVLKTREHHIQGLGRWEVRNGLLNRTTLKPVADKTEERMEIEVLKEVGKGCKQVFQKWVAERKCLRRMLCHPNLLHPFGYAMDEKSLFAVYPSSESKSLRNILEAARDSLSWDNRLTISVEAARGLAVLHTGSPPAGFIPCFKDLNIQVDENSKVKLLGFGLTDPGYGDDQIICCDQYFAPEYSGIMKIKRRHRKKKLYKLMDSVIRGQYAPAAGFEMTRIILTCLADNPEERPTANEVLKQLEDIKNVS